MNQTTLKNLFGVFLIIFLSFCIYYVIKLPQASNSVSNNVSQLQNSSNKDSSIIFNQPVQTLPETGTTVKYYNVQALAPLSIKTKSDGSNYLIKVLDWNTKNTILTTFIRSGETASLKVPLGSYEIRYASGETWYGYNYLFGPSTSYYKAESRMDFTQSGNTYNGHTIELIPRAGGNLKTEKINKNNF